MSRWHPTDGRQRSTRAALDRTLRAAALVVVAVFVCALLASFGESL